MNVNIVEEHSNVCVLCVYVVWACCMHAYIHTYWIRLHTQKQVFETCIQPLNTMDVIMISASPSLWRCHIHTIRTTYVHTIIYTIRTTYVHTIIYTIRTTYVHTMTPCASSPSLRHPHEVRLAQSPHASQFLKESGHRRTRALSTCCAMYVRICMCTKCYLPVYVHKLRCIYVCMYARMYVCMSVCMYGSPPPLRANPYAWHIRGINANVCMREWTTQVWNSLHKQIGRTYLT
jgi:hypothetical protein